MGQAGGQGSHVAQFGLYDDKSLQLYVNGIGQKLVSNLSDKEFNKYFFQSRRQLRY